MGVSPVHLSYPRVRAKISWRFGASAGWADARRRDAGDVQTSSTSGNAADACPPPHPVGLMAPKPAMSGLTRNLWVNYVRNDCFISRRASCRRRLASRRLTPQWQITRQRSRRDIEPLSGLWRGYSCHSAGGGDGDAVEWIVVDVGQSGGSEGEPPVLFAIERVS